MKFEKTSREDTIKNIDYVDKHRANYYNKYTGRIWGDKNNYEISIDTSKVGVEETINILEKYIKERIKASVPFAKNKEKTIVKKTKPVKA